MICNVMVTCGFEFVLLLSSVHRLQLLSILSATSHQFRWTQSLQVFPNIPLTQTFACSRLQSRSGAGWGFAVDPANSFTVSIKLPCFLKSSHWGCFPGGSLSYNNYAPCHLTCFLLLCPRPCQQFAPRKPTFIFFQFFYRGKIDITRNSPF